MNGTVKCPQCKCLIHTADTSFSLLEKNGELRQENESLRQQLSDAQKQLAAYEAEPVVTCCQEDEGFVKRMYRIHPTGTLTKPNAIWKTPLIRKPTSTAHLDAEIAKAEARGMERAAETCEAHKGADWFRNSEGEVVGKPLATNSIVTKCAIAIRAAIGKEQP